MSRSIPAFPPSEVTLSDAERREYARHYVAASETDVAAMLAAVGSNSLDDLFSHINPEDLFAEAPELPEEMDYDAIPITMNAIAGENRRRMSFIGDGLPDLTPSPMTAPVCAIRNLATAYTPYQPELSQGTLLAHWIYQCTMARLTGFEAINASLYERASAIFEGIMTATRMGRGRRIAVVAKTIFPGDIEVLETLSADTALDIRYVEPDAVLGTVTPEALAAAIAGAGDGLAAVVFPHVNTFGLLEDVDRFTTLAREVGAKSVAIIDPLLLAEGGLKPPSEFGAHGADIIVGEAQHLALGPNFGGPGLGLFGVRFSDKDRAGVRAAPGRFIGKACDIGGRECRVSVLSTREQHIRKDKATSNICSNQAFIATLVGAALLERGDAGLSARLATIRGKLDEAVEKLTALPGVRLAFPGSACVHELTLELDRPVAGVIEAARQAELHIGVDVSGRVPGSRHLLKLSFSDREQDIDRVCAVLGGADAARGADVAARVAIPESARRTVPPGIKGFSERELTEYYQQLGELNVSPDDGCYPLGSCTMKYNPKLNEWAAGLSAFADLHPQVPLADAQGSLKLLFEIQEWFVRITGLAAVTTQPVAGAQGELVGLKLFQAYHRDRGERRDIILIPRSAHGTNFATATVAGFSDKTGKIVYLDADDEGCVLLEGLERCIEEYGTRIAGVMITNPNTSGIFESRFRAIAERIHAIGGLVYMDGANMNAIAGWVDLGALGVDAVHNNLHKTWSIPHGGGGPGDAIVAVSERLVEYLPGYQIEFDGSNYAPVKPSKSIGSFHRHWGNFAHKVRCYTYLLRLGKVGVRRMTAMAVLSARYLQQQLTSDYATLPPRATRTPRMHEFIITLQEADYKALESVGLRKVDAAPRIGKLFLDFGFHAPTVAWPEPLGLMIEPTECYSKDELDRFAEAVRAIIRLVRERPDVLNSAPHFTPIDRVDEVAANRDVCLNETLDELPTLPVARTPNKELARLPVAEIVDRILAAVA